MRILLLCDDRYHPGDVPIVGIAPLFATADVITDTTAFDFAHLTKYDMVILSKSDHISRENHAPWKTLDVQKAFVEYVENGGGLLVTHSGTVAGEDTALMDNLIGSKFIMHPNRCPVTVGVVKPHPVTDGVGIFCEIDEQYRLEILQNDIDVLLASYAPPQGAEAKYQTDAYNNYPAHIATCGYVRTRGKGRICVLAPGHLVEVWLNAEFQKLLANGVQWCVGVR